MGIDAFCRKDQYSGLARYTTMADRRPTHRTTARCEIKLRGRRGDRTRTGDPWSPSTYFLPRAEFDLECFRREMVGMTTRARVMDFVGIAWT